MRGIDEHAEFSEIKSLENKKIIMAFWDDIGKAFEDAGRAIGNVVEAVVDGVSDVLDAVADVVETVVHVVFEFVADLYTSIGNGIADLFNLIGDELKKNPVTGWLGEILGWVGDIIGAVFTFLGDAVKTIASYIVGIVRGVINIVRGIITLNSNLILKGLADIATGILGGLVVLLGSLASVIQTIIPGKEVQGRRRALSKNEIQVLKTIFHNSVALYNVRVIDGNSGIYQVNDRPFVLGNTIYMKNTNTSGLDYLSILSHEVLHVWQYQNLGSYYATEALGAQISIPNAYDWEQEINAGRTEWVSFNMEAQGKFIEDIFIGGELLTSPRQIGNGCFFKGDSTTVNSFMYPPQPLPPAPPISQTDYTLKANNAVSAIRSKTNFRLSQFFT